MKKAECDAWMCLGHGQPRLWQGLQFQSVIRLRAISQPLPRPLFGVSLLSFSNSSAAELAHLPCGRGLGIKATSWRSAASTPLDGQLEEGRVAFIV
jgi:hypothetical protein